MESFLYSTSMCLVHSWDLYIQCPTNSTIFISMFYSFQIKFRHSDHFFQQNETLRAPVILSKSWNKLWLSWHWQIYMPTSSLNTSFSYNMPLFNRVPSPQFVKQPVVLPVLQPLSWSWVLPVKAERINNQRNIMLIDLTGITLIFMALLLIVLDGFLHTWHMITNFRVPDVTLVRPIEAHCPNIAV